MIYIIGVDHLIQYNNGIVPGEMFVEFSDYLREKVRILDTRLLAEEFSGEALHDVYGATIPTVKNVALKLGIEHRYCDPEENDRKRLGIPYFADITDIVKKKHDIPDRSIREYELKKQINSEASEISKDYWGLREEFWFSRISDSLDRNIIFICGHEHVERFMNLVVRKGVKCSVLEPFWEKEIFSDYGKLGI